MPLVINVVATMTVLWFYLFDKKKEQCGSHVRIKEIYENDTEHDDNDEDEDDNDKFISLTVVIK